MSATAPCADKSAMLSAMPQPVLLLDGEQVVFANAGAEAFFGLSAALLVGRPLGRIAPAGHPLAALVARVRALEAPVNEYGVDLDTARTPRRQVDMHGVPMTASGSGAGGAGAVMVVMQERQAAQMMDRHLAPRAAARTVTGMSAMLAHEIKNPLSGIRGAAQLLEMSAPGERAELARLICRETDRICHLVERMEGLCAAGPPVRKAMNIHAVLDHVRKLALHGFAGGMALAREYDPSLPPVIGDQDQLVQVFLNLVKNAAEAVGRAEAAGEKGQGITLRTAYRPGLRLRASGAASLALEVCIIDTGAGVPAEVESCLFDPFVSATPGGAGLGLALVAQIVQEHDGVVEHLRGPEGTVFRVRLPHGAPAAPGRRS